MLPNQPVTALGVYGTDASYIQAPDAENRRAGVVPLDTLPAQWWNYLWNSITSQENNTVRALNSVWDELKALLTEANIVPNTASNTQVRDSLLSIVDRVATESKRGTVVSSPLSGNVSVDENGVMTANGLGDTAELTTNQKDSLVLAINELKETINEAITELQTYVQAQMTTLQTDLENEITALKEQIESENPKFSLTGSTLYITMPSTT